MPTSKTGQDSKNSLRFLRVRVNFGSEQGRQGRLRLAVLQKKGWLLFKSHPFHFILSDGKGTNLKAGQKTAAKTIREKISIRRSVSNCYCPKLPA